MIVRERKKRLCVFATEHKNDFRTDRKIYVFTFMCFMFCVFVFLGMLQWWITVGVGVSLFFVTFGVRQNRSKSRRNEEAMTMTRRLSAAQ